MKSQIVVVDMLDGKIVSARCQTCDESLVFEPPGIGSKEQQHRKFEDAVRRHLKLRHPDEYREARSDGEGASNRTVEERLPAGWENIFPGKPPEDDPSKK